MTSINKAPESPEDTMQRVLLYGLRISGVRIGCDLKIFNILSSNNTMTITQLAIESHSDPILLRRICRYLSSINMIKETQKDTFAATNVTRVLSDPGVQAGVYHYFDNAGPGYQALPDFLKENAYQNVTDNTKTAFHKAFPDAAGAPGFVWMLKYPQRFGYFNQWMATQRKGMQTWLDVYPIGEETKSLRAEDDLVVFVDVGGGLGHQANAFKSKYPNLEGRVVLQDLPFVLERAVAKPDIEVMGHDFFKPQPIKGLSNTALSFEQ